MGQLAPSASPSYREACPRCHGRGWVITADGGNGTARPCDCRKQRLGPELLERAGLPERYRACSLKNFNTGHTHQQVQKRLFQARRICEQYVDDFFDPATRRFCSSGLIFVGPPGVGKTHLAAAVLKELIERYHVRGRFVDFTSLLHQIQSTFDPSSSESKSQILDPVIDAELLVLDELGAHKKRWNDWVMEILYLIMNTRYTRRLPTLFTTNYQLDEPQPRHAAEAEHTVSDRAVQGSAVPDRGARNRAPGQLDRPELLTSRMSPNLVSRLYEMAQPVRFAQFDYRREVMHYQRQYRG